MAGECKEGWMAGAEVGVSAGLSNAENMINECRGCRATGYMGGGVIKRHIMGRGKGEYASCKGMRRWKRRGRGWGGGGMS